MSIKTICQTNVITANKSTTLKEIAFLMQKNHVGSVVITEGYNGNRIPSGIITDRDIAMAVGAAQNPQDLRVEQIMQSHPVTVKTEEGIYETIVKMKEMGVKRIPVTNADGTLYGMVCSDDLLVLMGDEINNLAQITDVQIHNEQGIRIPKESSIQI